MPEPRDASAARDASALRPRGRGRLAIAIGLVALVAAIVFARRDDAPASHVTLTAGPEGTTRALVAHAFAAELKTRGIDCSVIAEDGSQDEIDGLSSGAVDFALVSAVFRSEQRTPGIRVVAPLQIEALHLMVKRELAARVDEGLVGLRGRSIDLGPDQSASDGLARAVLAFGDVEPADDAHPGGYIQRNHAIGELEALIDRRDRAALPDAIFHLATMPSLTAQKLVRDADYVVVALPFAEAFRLQAILESDAREEPRAAGFRRAVTEAVIPPFLYQTKPAVPDTPLPTLGARLLLLAHERVSDATVEHVLEAAFDTRFARILHPPLDRSLLAGLPRRELHSGSIAYLKRHEPAINGEVVGELSNTLSVLGALVGSGAFVLQGWRQRQRARRELLVSTHLLRVAELERQIVEAELSANLDLDTLIAVQRQLLELKSDALQRFTSGELDDQSLLSNLLDPVNAARDHVGELLLHVRAQLEDVAEAQGRTSSSVWKQAAAGDDPSVESPADPKSA